MLSKVLSSTLIGIDGFKIIVEVDISQGLPAFDIVGLPDSAVKESKDRVRTAIKNSDINMPVKRITINLLILYNILIILFIDIMLYYLGI